jgi:hypothetical protein
MSSTTVLPQPAETQNEANPSLSGLDRLRMLKAMTKSMTPVDQQELGYEVEPEPYVSSLKNLPALGPELPPPQSGQTLLESRFLEPNEQLKILEASYALTYEPAESPDLQVPAKVPAVSTLASPDSAPVDPLYDELNTILGRNNTSYTKEVLELIFGMRLKQ